MVKKYRNRAQENSRIIRIPLATYSELRQMAIKAQVSIGEVVKALAKLEPIKEKQAEILFQVTPPSPEFNLSVKSGSNISNIEIKPKGGVIDGT